MPGRCMQELQPSRLKKENNFSYIRRSDVHHAYSGEDQAAKADDRASIDCESFEGCHQRLRPREVHRSLGMGNACEGQRNERRSHHTRCAKECWFGKGLRPRFRAGIGRPIERLFQSEWAADSEHMHLR
jgi:hypothetical protein